MTSTTKKAAEKKAPAKKKASTKKKATANTILNFDSYKKEKAIAKLGAIFWAEFVTSAKLPVHYNCLDTAMDELHGALGNLNSNWVKLKPPKKKDEVIPNTAFADALKCASAAGERALKIANDNGQSEIDTVIFSLAWDCVANGCDYLAKRGARRKVDPIKIEALLC